MDSESSYANLGDGRKTVTSAGTAVRLVAANTSCRKVDIQALLTNTDTVVVGSSTVVAAEGTRRGLALVPGASVTLRVLDLYPLYVDAVVSGEGVSYAYYY